MCQTEANIKTSLPAVPLETGTEHFCISELVVNFRILTN